MNDRFSFLSLALSISLLGAGCDSGKSKVPSTPNGSSGSDTTLTRGGKSPAEDDVLMLSYNDDPDTLNLVTSNDTTSTGFQRQVYESLANQSFPDPDAWEPALAESWELDEETLTFKIKLRKGVYWHPINLPNGKALPRTEFTAADVKFTFDCILNEGVEAASLRSYYTNPEAKDDSQKYKIKVSVVDPYTVKIQWVEPYFLAKDFTIGIPIMPRHVYSVDKNGEPISLDFRNSSEFASAFNEHWANKTMCGTGPLIFKEWKKEQEVTLVRNPDYWGQPYFFSKVIYRSISNPNTALQQLLQNELDWSGIPQKDHYVQSKKHENVVAGKVNLVDYKFPGYRYMGYNLKRDFFKDKNVRLAISHAVPVDEIVEKIYFNLADRLTGPFLPGSSACDDSLKPIPHDLDEAKSLLDKAGWKDTDEDGIRDKVVEGKQVKAVFDLMIYATSPQYRQIAEIIRENCRQIGVEVKITPTKWALMLQKLRKKDFDATILGWALNWKGDPFQLWHGSQADLPESSNAIGYKNADLDKLIEELRVTMNEDKQQEIYHQIHKIIYDDQPYTFLFMDKATSGYHARLDNINFYKIRPCIDSREWISTKARVLSK